MVAENVSRNMGVAVVPAVSNPGDDRLTWVTLTAGHIEGGPELRISDGKVKKVQAVYSFHSNKYACERKLKDCVCCGNLIEIPIP